MLYGDLFLFGFFFYFLLLFFVSFFLSVLLKAARLTFASFYLPFIHDLSGECSRSQAVIFLGNKKYI